jgi:hypothetical protein
MPNELAERTMQEPVELIPDFSYEDRHEFVERLAYKLWEERVDRPARPTSIGQRRSELCTRRW